MAMRHYRNDVSYGGFVDPDLNVGSSHNFVFNLGDIESSGPTCIKVGGRVTNVLSALSPVLLCISSSTLRPMHNWLPSRAIHSDEEKDALGDVQHVVASVFAASLVSFQSFRITSREELQNDLRSVFCVKPIYYKLVRSPVIRFPRSRA